MRVDGNHASTLGYEPNSYGERQQQADSSEPLLSLEGIADHWNHRTDDDYYSQPGVLIQLMKPAQQAALFANTARASGEATREIQIRHIGNCLKADPGYGKGVADALGIPLNKISKEAKSRPRAEARM